jgi:uncharacterized ion transporter superfamily protein YfcC
VVEALVGGASVADFAGNLVLCTVCLVLIVLAVIYLLRQLSRVKSKPRLSRENAEVLDYAIRRRQYALEQKEKQNSNQI